MDPGGLSLGFSYPVSFTSPVPGARVEQKTPAQGKLFLTCIDHNRYDAEDNVRWITDRNGRRRRFSVTPFGEVYQERWYDPQENIVYQANFHWDGVGELQSATDNFSHYSFDYDDFGRLEYLRTKTGFDRTVSVTLQYRYDQKEDNQYYDSFTIFLGGVSNTTKEFYDPLGRVNRIDKTISETPAQSYRVDLQYTALDQLKEIKRLDTSVGITTVATTAHNYNDHGYLDSIVHQHGADTTEFGYGYDRFGRIDTLTSTFPGEEAKVQRFGYDSFSQLENATHPDFEDENYQYDGNGNRIGNRHKVKKPNRIERDGKRVFEYDQEGNRVSEIDYERERITSWRCGLFSVQ